MNIWIVEIKDRKNKRGLLVSSPLSTIIKKIECEF